MSKVYNRIDEILKWELGITQKEFALKIDMAYSSLNRIASGRDVYITTAQRIARGLSKKVDEVWPAEREV